MVKGIPRFRFLFAAFVLSVFFSASQSVFSQHEGHRVPTTKPAPASPSPTATPQPPASTGSGHMHNPAPRSDETKSPPEKSSGMEMSAPASVGPLLVMAGDDMGIRVGASETNVMSMAAMGSGTTWQPSSAPMYMAHQQSGDWLIMWHYNLVAGINSQGGPRALPKWNRQTGLCRWLTASLATELYSYAACSALSRLLFHRVVHHCFFKLAKLTKVSH